MKEERSASRATDEGKAPTVSVIVPVYNVEKYLRQCLDSILAQTFTDFELLLIDDGSPDTSGTICDEYASRDPRVRVFHQPNSGVSAARNVGIEQSKGELICFVDSDDWVEPNYCQTIVDSIGDAEMLIFGTADVYPDGSRIIRYSGALPQQGKEGIEESVRMLMDNKTKADIFAAPWNKAFKSEIIKKENIRFVEGLFLYEDEVFCFEVISKSAKLSITDSLIYNHSFFAEGLSHKNMTMQNITILTQCLEKICSSIENEGIKKYIKEVRMPTIISKLPLQEKNTFKRFSTSVKALSFCKKHNIRYPYRKISVALLKKTLKDMIGMFRSERGNEK